MRPSILAIGEVLWDLLPSGAQLGGAPTNFAFHAHALGANARLVSRIGRDELGDEILRRFEARSLPTNLIQRDAAAPTGTVTVALDEKGQPRYTIHENVAWDRIDAPESALAAASRADAVCFGSLAQRREISRAAIQKLVARAPRESLKIFDVNLRQRFFSREVLAASFALANAAKLNEDELCVLAPMFDLSGDPRTQLAQLAAKFDLRLIALTRGADGSILFADGNFSECKPPEIQIVDSIGAGDSFTAAMALGWLAKKSPDEINRRANEVAGFVCLHSGATPALPEKIVRAFWSE